MWGNLTAYGQILVHLALTSINENYMLGNGNLKLKVTLNEQLEVLECMLLAGCSLCFFFFQALSEEQINMTYSGIPKVPGDLRKVESSQEHGVFRGDSLEAKHSCSLDRNAASVLRLSLAGVYDTSFYLG